MINQKTIKRQINYYELNPIFKDEFDAGTEDKFTHLFQVITSLSKTKAEIRYQQYGEKLFFVQDLKFEPETKLVLGKLRCIRMDDFPEIFNTTTDIAREIPSDDVEGVVETTHFIVDYSKSKKKLAFEVNFNGARINEFIHYLQAIGFTKNILEELGFNVITRDVLDTMLNRINRCSEFVIKIHKDNIQKLEEADEDLFKVIELAREKFEQDYVTLSLKFDYKKKSRTDKVRRTISNLAGFLKENDENLETFNKLSVKAEDSDKNNKLEVFDLLVDKLKSDLTVERRQKSKTIISEDIYNKMKKEMIRLKI